MFLMNYLIKPLAYVSLPVIILKQLLDISPAPLRYYIRLGLYISTLSVCSIWGVICSITLPLVGHRYHVNWVVARTFQYLVKRAIDIKFVVEGEEHLKAGHPAVIISNHQSMLDVAMLGAAFPKRGVIMAKKELQWVPFLGQFLAASGAIFVDRGNNAKAIRSLTAAGETMKTRDVSLWLFAEGTRSMREYPDMLPFKKGAFHIAVRAGVPVVPVVVENYWKLYRKGVFEAGTVRIKILPPIQTKDLSVDDVTDLSIRAREVMVKAMREISPQVDPSLYPAEKPSASPSQPNTNVEKQEQADPLAGVPSISAESRDSLPESRSESRASTTFSEDPSSPALSRQGGSENGVETEEDEGMVLVGRP